MGGSLRFCHTVVYDIKGRQEGFTVNSLQTGVVIVISLICTDIVIKKRKDMYSKHSAPSAHTVCG